MGLGPQGIGVETEKGCSGHVQMLQVGVAVGLEQRHRLRQIQLRWLLKMARRARQERKDDAAPACPQCVHSTMGPWWERPRAGLHISSSSLGLDWGRFSTLIFLEAFSSVHWPVPSPKIVADNCKYLWLQRIRLRGPAAVPAGKVLRGAAEHQPGEEGGEFGDKVVLWMES